MAQLRQQFLRQVAVPVILDTATLAVDVLGPESTLEPPYAENSDHVVRARQVRQNEAGFVQITGWDGSVLDDPDVLLDVEIWKRAASAAQKGLEAPLFPSGAAAAADPVLQRVVATDLPGDGADLLSILGGATPPAKDVPLLHVRADEFVRLRITNNTGGNTTALTLSAKFDLGMNPVDTNRL